MSFFDNIEKEEPSEFPNESWKPNRPQTAIKTNYNKLATVKE